MRMSSTLMSWVIYVQCCVCKRMLGTKDGHGQHGVSHTYCDTCMAKVMSDMEVSDA